MIIHPAAPPHIMAALDAHPLCTRHLALALFGLTVCITTLFNGLFRRAGGVGGREGRKLSKSFQYVRTQQGATGKVQARVINGTMLKWRAEGAGSGDPLHITESLSAADRLLI